MAGPTRSSTVCSTSGAYIRRIGHDVGDFATAATSRPQTDHEMVVTGGEQRSPTVTPTWLVTWEASKSRVVVNGARVPSHGRGHWFETSIAHSILALKHWGILGAWTSGRFR